MAPLPEDVLADGVISAADLPLGVPVVAALALLRPRLGSRNRVSSVVSKGERDR